MTRSRRALIGGALLLVVGVVSVLIVRWVRSSMLIDLEVAPDFALLDQQGKFHQLSRYATARAVVLYAHDFACPAAREDLAALQETRKTVAEKNVAFLLLDANPRDDRGTLRREAAKAGVDLPILQDNSGLITDVLRVRRSGEAILLDTATWRIAYRGPVEQDGPNPGKRRHPLARAIGSFLAGRSVRARVRDSGGRGCAIARDGRTDRTVSYAADVAPILKAKCVACHRQGGIAPWAMDDYDRVKTWSPRMRSALLTGRMPPWHADPLVGEFANDRSLNVDQKRTLLQWIDAGASRGPGSDPLAARTSAVGEEWPLGKPDAVLELPTQTIPATGTLEYRYIHLPAPVTRDTWVRAVHIAPRNPRVMHHAALFIQYPWALQHLQPHWEDGAGGFFAAYAPGLPPSQFPPDSGGFLPAGSMLIFQLHYTTTGSSTTDVPRAAFYFHPRPPALAARVVGGVNKAFSIPPNADDYPVVTTYVFDRLSTLHGLLPHMHFRGKRFQFEAHYPDGTRELLLSVPRYDFNWQTLYTFKVPKAIPAGTQILMSGAFDNSARNPANPDPSKEVHFGEQSWDEMFIGYLLYTVPRGGARETSLTPPGRSASPRG